MIRRRSQAAFLLAIAGLTLLETWGWSVALQSVFVEAPRPPNPDLPDEEAPASLETVTKP